MKELQTSDFCGAMRTRMRISDLPLNAEGCWQSRRSKSASAGRLPMP
jgi:hypothetical protein